MTFLKHPRSLVSQLGSKSIFHVMETTYVVLAIALLMGAFKAFFVPPPTEILEDQPTIRILQIVYGVIYAYPLIFFVQKFGWLRRIAWNQKLMSCFIAWCAISTLWSVIPDISTRRLGALFGLAIFALYLCARFDYRRQLLMIHHACVLCLLCTVVSMVVIPKLSWYDDGRFITLRGIFDQKNVQGFSALIGILSYMGMRTLAGLSILNPRGILLLASYLMLILAAHTATTLLTLLLILGALAIARASHWLGGSRKIRSAIFVTAAAIFFVSAIFGSDALLDSLGRDKGLTGRTDLWMACLEQGSNHPIIGYGFNGFWNGYAGPSRSIWQVISWHPYHAHNGPLDIYLQLGIVGLAILVLWIGSILARCLSLKENAPLLYCLICEWLLIVFSNLSESRLTSANSIMFLLLVQISLMSTKSSAKWHSVRAEPQTVISTSRDIRQSTEQLVGRSRSAIQG